MIACMNQPAHITKMSEAEFEACREVIREIARGANLGEYLADIGMTTIRFYELAETTPELSAAYARAKRARAELVAQEIVAIADSEQDAQRARNRIQARQWYASKILPREYGDRMDINVTQTIDIGSALQDARARALRPVCDQRGELDSQAVDYMDVLPTGPADEQSSVQLPAPAPARSSLTARANQAAGAAPAQPKRGRKPKGAP
jgi:hypothetical protein